MEDNTTMSDNQTFTMILEDGTKLENVHQKYLDIYECDGIIEESVLNKNCAKLIIKYSDSKESIHTNMIFDCCRQKEGHTEFRFRPKDALDIAKDNITYIQKSIITLYDLISISPNITKTNITNIPISQQMEAMNPISIIYYELISKNIENETKVPKALENEVKQLLDWHKEGYI